MVDTVRTQAELLAFLHPNIGNPMPDATVLVSQAARDLIVSIFAQLPGAGDVLSGDNSQGVPITTGGIPGLGGPGLNRARRLTVLDGSPAHPVLDIYPTAYISRYFTLTPGTVTNNQTALQAVAQANGPSSPVGNPGYSQANGIYGWAVSSLSDADAAAVLGTAFVQPGALSTYKPVPDSSRFATAFGMFAEGVSYDPYGFANGINPFVAVTSTQPYTAAGTPFSSGVFIQTQALTNHLGSFTVVISPGSPISISRSFTVTISNANPAVATAAGNDLALGTQIQFTTTGTLPAPLQVGVNYYVLAPSGSTFRIAATPGGAAIATTNAGSGTHTVFGAHGLSTGDSFILASTGTLPGALTVGTVYFVVNTSTYAFNPAATLGGAAINNATGGSGIQTLGAYVEVGPGALTFANEPANSQFSQGFLTTAGSVRQQGFSSRDSATTGFSATGSHVNSFDASGDIVSGLMYKVATNAGLTATAAGTLITLSFETGYGIIHDTGTHRTEFFGNGSLLGYILGNWAPAANQTAWHMFEGVTPTDRQVRWVDSGVAGAGIPNNSKVMVLV